MNTKKVSLRISAISMCLMSIASVRADIANTPGQTFTIGAVALLIWGGIIGGLVWFCLWIIRKIRNKNIPIVNKNVRK